MLFRSTLACADAACMTCATPVSDPPLRATRSARTHLGVAVDLQSADDDRLIRLLGKVGSDELDGLATRIRQRESESKAGSARTHLLDLLLLLNARRIHDVLADSSELHTKGILPNHRDLQSSELLNAQGEQNQLGDDDEEQPAGTRTVS